jgi:dihydroorotate dehydrogenase electron transfer subunit
LYPTRLHQDGFTSVDIPSPAWVVGALVDLLGPIGSGFSPPSKSSRWLLIAYGRQFDRLYPLIDAAVESSISVAVFSDSLIPDLPVQVEIVTKLEDARDWADYIAIDLHVSSIAELAELLASQARIPPAAYVEMLVDTPLACGLGVCAVCAVVKGTGWRLACKDGPVFNMKAWLW